MPQTDPGRAYPALRIFAPAASLDALRLPVETLTLPDRLPEGMALVEVAASGVNPSDVKAALGAMPKAVWPRTPGRDYAGTVVEGPQALRGRLVWGSGGELGITRDGAHARYLLVPAAHLRPAPEGMDPVVAGAIGVPFVTAWAGWREAGGLRPGMTALVLGATGKVGQAAIQLATMAGARVIGVARRAGPFPGHASAPVTMLGADQDDVAEQVLEATGGHGADLVFNTVGSPYFAAANRAMAHGGTQILIATIERSVPFDILAFYRARHRYVGVDTLALDGAACAAVLEALRPDFEAGRLRPFAVPPGNVFGLGDAATAYRAVLEGAPERVVIAPGKA
ncbi:MAG TPA: zinc-binding alcohol dehydrogenase family protein [Crenalkalicoccus sp.]|nr:zinc-binding alcohol dehydrogenase family protein [Crenalkalicoccus sp.]